MGVIKEWNEYFKHPHSTYGEMIDYDGIRRGPKPCTFRGPQSEEEAQEIAERQSKHYEKHLALKEEKDRLVEERRQSLVIVTSLIYVLSRLFSGKTEEEVSRHHYPDKFEGVYFAQKGEWTTTVYAAGFVLHGREARDGE